MLTDHAVTEAARAVLDGTPVDWDGLEASADPDLREFARQFKVLAAVAGVHRAQTIDVRPGQRPVESDRSPDGAPTWGHLRLFEKVGSGAFGEVYRAWDTRLDREVALKLLPEGAAPGDDSSPIIEEGRLLARVRHPNVATIYGAERLEGRVGLWMEFVRGRTLEGLLRSGHEFGVPEVLHLGVDVCRAVSAVHEAGLLHRDVKAQNVMRADDGRVVLMDFGTGREQMDGRSDAAGTPLYLAPEVLGGGQATVQSDVYSVGVLLHHLLTGGYPVHASTLGDLRRAHEEGVRNSLPAARPALPPALTCVVERATHTDPARRHASCDALAADLVSLLRRPKRRRIAALAALAAGVVTIVVWSGWLRTERPAIAVLPFKNLSTEVDGELIADGLTSQLISSLATVDGLDVRSATSSFALKAASADAVGVAQELGGVNHVLEGSVQGAAGRWRVHAQLVRVGSDQPIWSGRFDQDAQNVLDVQGDIARAVANELRVALGGLQRRYDLDEETSSLYLKARALVARRGAPNAQAAIPMLEQVIARDPGFAPAYAGLADAYAFFSQDLPDVGGLPPDRALELMRPVADKALELDPLLAEAHAAQGILLSREHEWARADEAFRRAIDLNPSLTHVYTDYALTTLQPLGRFDEAEALLEEAERRDPLAPIVWRESAVVYLNTGRFDEAIENLERVNAVDPDLAFGNLLLARALSFAGRIEEAMPYWEADQGIGRQHWMAYAFVRAGRRAEVEQMAAEHQNPYRLAIIYAALGDVDRALEALDRAAEEAPHRVVRLLNYPEMAPLRGDPRFDAIRARFRLP